MKVSIYQAAFLCEDCTNKTKKELNYLHEDLPQHEYDSNNYPKGLYENGGGESDTPGSCDHCHIFLENPLTGDGIQYVLDVFVSCILQNRINKVVQEWIEFYKDDYYNDVQFELMDIYTEL